MRRISERMWVGGLAAAGVVMSHSLSYMLVSPNPHDRVQLLRATGHRYFTWVTALALGALVAGLAGGALRRLRSKSHRRPTGPRLFVVSALALSVLQIGGWLALEASERLLAGGTVAGLMGEPVVAVGIVMQIAVALVAALLIVGLAHVVDHIASRLVASHPRSPSTRTLPWRATSILPPSLSPVEAGRTLRGPPAGSR